METTTHEALHALRNVVPKIVVLGDIESFLQTADLVKFAKLVPTEAECYSTLARAEELVRRTMPPMIIASPPPPPGPANKPPSARTPTPARSSRSSDSIAPFRAAIASVRDSMTRASANDAPAASAASTAAVAMSYIAEC